MTESQSNELVARLEPIFREFLDDPSLRLTPNFSMTDHANWDSVATVQIVLAIEEMLGIRFSTAAIAEASSVRKLIDAITKSETGRA